MAVQSDIDQILSGAGTPTTAPPSGQSDTDQSDIDKILRGASSAPPATSQSAPGMPPGWEPGMPPPWMRSYANAAVGGLGTGLGDVTKTVGGWLGLPTPPNLAPPADVQQAQAQHPWVSTGGRLVGDIAGTAPLAAIPGAAAAEALPGLELAYPAATTVGRAALSGGTANALVSGGYDQNPLLAFGEGAATAGLLSLAGRGIGNAWNRYFGIGPVAADDAALAAKLKTSGVDTAPYQLSPDPAVRQAGASAASQAATKQQVNSAYAVKAMGMDPTDVSPQGGSFNDTTWNKGMGEIGDRIDANLPNVRVQTTTPEFNAAMAQVRQHALDNLGPDNLAIFDRHYNRVLGLATDPANNGVIPGDQLQALISKNGSLTKAGDARTDTAPFISELKGVLLDGAAAGDGSPASQAAYQNYQMARGEWKAGKTIEPLIAKSPDNLFSPEELMPRVIQQYGADQVARGQAGPNGIVGDLAKAGQSFLRPTVVTPTPSIVGGVVQGAGRGAALSSGFGSFWPAAVEATRGGAQAAGPTVYRAMINNPVYRDFLNNQLASPGNPLPRIGALGINQLRDQLPALGPGTLANKLMGR